MFQRQSAKVVTLFQRQLTAAMAKVDSTTAESVREVWKQIGPAPTCPFIGDVMGQIQRALATGFNDMEATVSALVIETTTNCSPVLSKSLVRQLGSAVEVTLLSSRYVALVELTPGVYERSRAPRKKFDEQTYNIELASIKAAASNALSSIVSRIRLQMEAACLKKSIGTPTWQKRGGGFLWSNIGLPVIKWVIPSVGAALAAYLGFKQYRG